MNNYTHIATFEFGILSCYSDSTIFKFEFTKDVTLTYEQAEEVYHKCNEIANAKKYYLITFMTTKLTPSKGVYDFYNAKERANHIIKEAFILHSTALKIAANFYFKVKKPVVEGKIFNNEQEATNWLLK
jgi:hypothetical protein